MTHTTRTMPRWLTALSALLAFAWVLGTPPSPAGAEETARGQKTNLPAPEDVAELTEALVQKRLREFSSPSAPYLPEIWCGDIDDEPTRTTCWEAYRASLQYYSAGLVRRGRVFEWQHMSTIVIFFVVIGLVLVSVYFAWIQFRRALESRADESGGEKSVGTTVELTTSGVKVSSPVLGVIILALALGFFYLYLVFVYRVQEIF